LGLATSLVAQIARAADHLDGAAVKMDKASDITDVFAWMSGDNNKVYLVMNVFPVANKDSKFSDKVKYVFHTNSHPSYPTDGGLGSPKDLVDVICTFDAAQTVSCWVVDVKAKKTLDYVTGSASDPKGLESTSKNVKVFAGLRDDPFFFNLNGFATAAAYVNGGQTANGTKFTFDKDDPMKYPKANPNAPCPTNVDVGAAKTILATTGKGGAPGMLGETKPLAMDRGAPVDFFKGLNALSLVIALDAKLLAADPATNKVVGVWAATTK
jgi:hypothetical protein